MILVLFLSRAVRHVARMLDNWHQTKATAWLDTKILAELGRKAWQLRKQHVGMEDILAELGQLETEAAELHAAIVRHEDDLYAGDPTDREHLREVRKGGARLDHVQRQRGRRFVLLGKALDASRHHDAALVDYYRRLDENRQQRHDLEQDSRARRKGMLAVLPLAVAEGVILLVLAVWAARGGIPVLTEYHCVFSDDFGHGAGQWTLANPKAGTLSVESSGLCLRSTGDVEARAFPLGVAGMEDVSVKVLVRDVSEAGIAGLVFRQTAQDSYVLEFRRDRSCRLSLWMPDGQDPLGAWKSPRGVSQDADTFEIELRCSGRKVWAFVDGKLALHQKTFESHSGIVGLAVSPRAEANIARFEVGCGGLRGWLAKRASRR